MSDPYQTVEYERFVRNQPCDGVLAGGVCDNIQDAEDYERDPDEQRDDDAFRSTTHPTHTP